MAGLRCCSSATSPAALSNGIGDSPPIRCTTPRSSISRSSLSGNFRSTYDIGLQQASDRTHIAFGRLKPDERSRGPPEPCPARRRFENSRSRSLSSRPERRRRASTSDEAAQSAPDFRSAGRFSSAQQNRSEIDSGHASRVGLATESGATAVLSGMREQGRRALCPETRTPQHTRPLKAVQRSRPTIRTPEAGLKEPRSSVGPAMAPTLLRRSAHGAVGATRGGRDSARLMGRATEPNTPPTGAKRVQVTPAAILRSTLPVVAKVVRAAAVVGLLVVA